jgi:hypothetical protein
MGGIPLPEQGTQGETVMLALGDERAAVEASRTPCRCSSKRPRTPRRRNADEACSG